MEIKVVNVSPLEVKSDLLVLYLPENSGNLKGLELKVDKLLEGLISSVIKRKEFSGKLNEKHQIHTIGKLKAERILLVGMGKAKEPDLEKTRQVAGTAVKEAKTIRANTVVTTLPSGYGARAFVEGALIGDYKFAGLMSGDDEKEHAIKELIIAEPDRKNTGKIEKGIRIGTILSECVNKARDLVNTPPNIVTPSYLADYAGKMAARNKLSFRVIETEEARKMGMGAFYSVARGSDEPAKIIVLKYKGKGKETFGLIGKGITFDSGGISLKPSKNLWQMKMDMSGAASIISVMEAVSALKPRVSVLAVIPCTENMPGGKASRPSDVVKSMSGKTIEIISTDAEGRMILADAITYAKKLGATKLIDAATLTGGCIVALGDVATGLMGNNRALIESVKKRAEEAGEKVWELPLYPEYGEYLKSEVADFKNCTDSGKASTGVGGTFLSRFAEDVPWVHLDIAGTAFYEKNTRYFSYGGTGVMVRTLTSLVCGL